MIRTKRGVGAIAAAMCGGILAAGCGGGSSSDDAATATGQFKDSNVLGLDYVSGGQTGVTGERGEFTYETGQSVTFAVGGVTLGTADGREVVTPIDLVDGGTSESPAVQNIARFLMMLDEDGDPDNGITIADEVRDIAPGWTALDFASGDFEDDVSDIVDAVDAAYVMRAVTLPGAAQARNHLESTLRCVYAGAFSGNYIQNNGSARGNFALLVSALNGGVSGWVWSAVDEHGEPDDIDVITLQGNQPIGYDQDVAFVSGFGSDSSNFSGRFTSPRAITGTYDFAYAVGGNGGTFTGARIGGAPNAVWRFTGTYGGTTHGVFTFDIDAGGTVTGRAYNVADDESDTLGGTLNGEILEVTIGGTPIAWGTIDTTTGAMSGTWDDADVRDDGESDFGTFSGDGCRLN